MGRKRIYTEEEAKERRHQYYLKNKERLLTKQNQYYKDNKSIYKDYYEANKEKKISYQIEYNKKYDELPISRAQNLLQAYNRADIESDRGKGDLTAQWIVDNIFTKKCTHCDKTGWKVIGCNRLDNSKPHTMDNVEPCCFECNCMLNGIEMKRDELGRFKEKGS